MSESGQTPRPVRGKQRLLLQVERFSRHHYRLVFLIAAVLVAASAFLGSKLKLESDILQLFPADNKYVATFRSAIEDFGSIDYLIVLLQAGEGEGADEIEDFADLLAERLEAMPELVERVEYRFRLDESFLDLFYDNALLFLDPQDLAELKRKLTDEEVLRQIRENRLSLAAPTAEFSDRLIVNDPLGLMPLFADRLLGSRGAFQVDLSDGYYLSRDGNSLLMLVKPTGHAQDLDFSQELLNAVRAAETETRRELAREAESYGDAAPAVRVDYTGNYAIALDEASLIRQDVKFNLVASLIAVSALYWLCYRRFAALLYSSVPLAVGQALTFAVAFFALQQLNASSSAFTALLMGLGTDFTIVMYARYVEERRAGHSLAVATEKMVGETGLGVFTGAITSAGTFYAMCISRFRGLFDLGFLIGTGILLCALAIVFLLPAMITWNEGVRRRKVDSVRKLHLQSFGLEHLITFSARHRAVALTIVALVTVAAGWLALQLGFDDSIKSLRSDRSQALNVQAEIGETFGASLSYMMVISDAPTRDEALRLTEAVEERLQPFIEGGQIASYDSVLSYIPPVERQERIIDALREGRDEAFDVSRIREAFVRGLDESGFRREAFADYLSRMERFLTPERPLRLDDLQGPDLEHLLGRYVREDDRGVRIVTYLFPNDPRWKRRPPPGLVEQVAGDDPGIVVTGTNVVSVELRKVFSRDAPQGVAVGLLIVFVLLVIDFRSLRLTAIAMAQLVCGVIIMLGSIKLAGMDLNYANAFVATMILGVGIDYSIHLVHRMNWNNGRIDEGTLETGKAVVLAALTNIAGFGTLTFGNYPALKSFGLVAMLGSVSCLLTALTVVPALMARRDGEGG